MRTEYRPSRLLRGHRYLLLPVLWLALVGPGQADTQRLQQTAASPGSPGAALTFSADTSPPLGLPPMAVPEENPPTRAKIELGKKLFFDRRLSFNRTLSCAMCHIPEQGFTQNELRTPVGVEGRFVGRNAPSLYNVGYRRHLFHDGRENSLENQIWQPLLKTNEMANPSVGFVLATVREAADYNGLFEKAFGRGPTMESLGRALASYQRTLVSAGSPFDRWYFGRDEQAMGERARRGFALFMSSGCSGCHTIGTDHALFTDDGFHDTGIGYARAMLPDTTGPSTVRLAPGVEVVPAVNLAMPVANDLGRYEATGRAQDRWLYLTPSLRNVALSAPYMHDGSFPDIASVLRFYNSGAVPHPGLDPRLRRLGLTPEQLLDLESFLLALTGDNTQQLARDGRLAEIGDSGVQ